MQQETGQEQRAPTPQEIADPLERLQMILSREGPSVSWCEALLTQWDELDHVVREFDIRITQLEAATGAREESEEEELHGWPKYANEDLRTVIANVEGLQGCGGQAPQMLYYIAEMEALLERIESRARTTKRKYEARLAASLRDICRVHNPSEFSQEQVDCLKGCVTALAEGWGKMTREKLNFVRARLLDRGLTWLPVTDKAAADLQEAKTRDSH